MGETDLSGYVVLDLETTTTSLLERKASVFSEDNWVVAAAYAKGKGETFGTYFGTDRGGLDGYLSDLLFTHNPAYLVGANIKFDILYLIRGEQDYRAYQDWIVRGGQLWDVQLVEYLLDGQRKESHMLSLDEIAPRYGGTLKIDEVKAMWAAGINTDAIPKQLLMDYLVGRGEDLGDIGNTRVTFLGQAAAVKAAGQAKSVALNNGALVATIEMERNGLYVDEAEGRKQAALLAEQVVQLKAGLESSLPKDLPFPFNWNSRKQISALIFGGKIKYKQQVHRLDENERPMYAKKKVIGYELADGTYTVNPPSLTKATGDYVFYGSGKKQGQPKSKQIDVDDHDRPKIFWEDFWYEFEGYTKPKPEWEGADAGYYSTAEEVIDELGGRGIEFLDNFADLKDLIKDLGTYYITEDFDDDGNVVKAKGMLVLVHKDGLVHANISMVSTVTGRFAHSKPNIGNLPRNDTSDVKKLFVSRWRENGVMMSSDFTSLEVYVQAILSNDEALIGDLLAGLDMHIKRLSQAESKDYDWLVEMIKVQKIKEWVVKRKDIKVFSFQKQYGAGAPKIARGLKLAVDIVQGWMDLDEQMYPGTKEYNDRNAQLVKQSRVPTQRFETHPQTKQRLQMGLGTLKTFDGKRYVFKEQIAPKFMLKRGIMQSFKPTEMKNYPVQGMGGEWMKAAMWLAVRAFYKYKNFDGLALLVNTVHDALYADAHLSVKRKAGVVLHASMLAASDFMEYHFGRTIQLPVPSETTFGPSMWTEESFDDPESFNASAERVRTWLRATFMGGYTPSYLKE